MILEHLTPEILVAASAFLLAIIFEHVPLIEVRFNTLSKNGKRAVMGVLMALVVLAYFVLSCAGWSGSLSCDSKGFIDAIALFGLALIGNKTGHAWTKKNK